MKRFFVLVLLSFCLVNQAFTQQMAIIDSELYELMNSNSSDKINVNIILKEQFDANQMNVRRSFSSREDRRTYMVNEMKAQTENLQADVLKTLKANERSVQVTDIKCHWLTNMINCNATPDAILKIAEHPDVKMIAWNKKRKVIHDESEKTTVETRATAAEIAENIAQVNAPQVWDLGFTGKGVVVAVIDSGANIDHVDLKDHLWDDGSGHCGFNTIDNSYNVYDGFHHGTHCAGTVCGDGTSGLATGVAPDAQLMVLKALDDEGGSAINDVVEAMEWAIEHGADVLSMSLGFNEVAYYVSDSETFRPVAVNALKAGVVAVVAAGNEGNQKGTYPVPQNVGSPGNCPPPWLHPDQITTGGLSSVICVGSLNYEATDARAASSEGPVTWLQTSYGDYRLGNVYPTKTLQHDNGTYSKNYYWTTADRFATLFTPSELAEFSDGAVLASVSIYDALEDGGLFYICQGGNTPSEGTQLHSQTYNHYGSKSMFEIALNKEVTIDKNQNLWVVFQPTVSANTIPVSTNTDNPNGRWLYKNGSWSTSIINETVMVRVNISTSNVPTELNVGLIRPDVCAPGSEVVSSSNESNSGYKTESGTSMATPCVAGTIALLLEANPELEPADICRVLETTAVKVAGATSKSNKTGSGMIDAYNAVLAVATDLPFVAPKLTATAKSSSRIDLSWTVAPGADSYTIYRNGNEIASGITTTSYSDTELDPETSYSYEIKAIRGSESVKSSAVSATTLSESAAIAGKYRIKVATSSNGTTGKYLHINSTAAPSGSTNVGVSAYTESDNQIFTIESADGGNYYLRSENGYYIKCDDQPNANNRNTWNVYAYSTTDKTPVYFDYTGTDGASFYIRDYDKKVGNGSSSNNLPNNNYFKVQDSKIYCDAPLSNTDVVTWTLEPVGPPAAPTGLVATAKGETSIGLTWNLVTGATSYNVYRDDSKIATGLTATSYTDNNGLTAETNYCYTVTAVNTNGESAKSTQACATTLAAGSAVEQEVTIGGDISSNYYAIPINPYYNHTFSQQIYTQSEIGTGAGIITKIAFKQYNTANTPGRKIKVYMQNVSKSSFTSYYDWVAVADSDEVFNGDISLPGDGQDLEITLSSSFAYTGENLLISVCDYTGSYTSPQVSFYTYQTADVRSLIVRSDPTSYNPLNMSNVEATAAPKQNNIIDITIKTGSAPSTPETVPDTPTGLVATAESSTSIALTWDAADGATSYNIYDAESNLVASTENNNYTVTELTPATNYCYTVKAVNAIGESEPSEQFCAETPAEDAAFEGVVTIGGDVNSNNTSSNLPISAYYSYTFSQQIYTQSEIGTGAGTITKLAFKKQTDRNTNRKIKVYMQNTSKASFASDTDWVSMTEDADKVFDGEVNLSGANNDLELTLNTPFSYTGENLLISVYDYTGTDNYTTYFYTYSADERSLYVRSYSTSYNPASMTASGTRDGKNNIIDITFVAGSSDPETPGVPDAPTGLAATAQSSTSIALTWNAVDGATSYNVYRDYEYVTNISATSFTDEGLNPSTEYVYTVKAVNSAGESAVSNEARATTEADNTGGGGGGSDVCTIVVEMFDSCGDGWNGDCLAYSLNGSDLEALEFTSGSSQTHTLKVAKGTKLYIEYWGSNSYAENSLTISYEDGDLLYQSSSPKAGEIVNTTVDCGGGGGAPALPDAPTNLTATAQGSSAVYLSWNAVNGVDGYNIYRGSSQIATGLTATSYTDEGLESSSTYCYTVKSVKDGVESVASNKECAETEPEAPSAPTNLFATAQSATSIGLIWSSVYGAESYKVYRNSQEIATNVTGISYTDNGLTASTNYCYTVKAVNSAGESEESSSACAMTYSLIPSTPTGLDVTAQSSSSIALTWNSVDGAESYKVYRDSEEIAINVTGTTYTDNGLTANKEYCYTVKAVNSAGESEESSPECATTYPLAPDAPTNLVATAQGTSTISLSWNGVVGATNYNIYRNLTQVATVTETSYVDNGLAPATEYVYTVKAVNIAGESGASNEARATTDAIVGIEQVVSIGNISNMTSTYLPFETYYTDSYSQQIYTKAEIESSGVMAGGTITKITFKQKTNTVATRKLKVYMQNVSTASFGSDKAWVNVTDVTRVFDGNVELSGTGDLVITLTSPLVYTGENLLISVLDYTGSGTSSTEFYTYGVNNRSIRFHNYNATIDPSSMSSVWGTRDGVNNVIDITFVMPIIKFTGNDGDWNNANNWNTGAVPNDNSNVAIESDLVITDDITVRTFTIEDGGSVTLESGSLTVKDDFTNTDASAFVIEEGAQVFQKNDDVMATFNMNIKAPASWKNDHTHGWQFIASPMKDATTASFVPAHGYDLFKYVGGIDLEWVNYKGHADVDFEDKFQQGRGYLASYETESVVEFAGVLNNETGFTFDGINMVNEEDYYANFYLLGNPFAFNMDWANVTAEGLASGLAVVTLDGNYKYAVDTVINVGDGFFVQVTDAEPSLTYNSNVRSRRVKHNFINIMASGKSGSDNVILNFAGNDEEGFAKLENFNKEIAEIYVKDEGRRYGIMNYEKDVEEIELYFDAKRMGEYTINAVTEGEFESVILVDRNEGIETDLLASSYTFKALSSDSPDRFIIRMGNDVVDDKFVYLSGDELVINAEGLVQIVDVMGRIIYSGEQNGVNRVDVSGLNSTYIVRNVNNNEVKTQKIVVF